MSEEEADSILLAAHTLQLSNNLARRSQAFGLRPYIAAQTYGVRMKTKIEHIVDPCNALETKGFRGISTHATDSQEPIQEQYQQSEDEIDGPESMGGPFSLHPQVRNGLSKVRKINEELSKSMEEPERNKAKIGVLTSAETLSILAEGAAAIGGEAGLDAALDSIAGIITAILMCLL